MRSIIFLSIALLLNSSPAVAQMAAPAPSLARGAAPGIVRSVRNGEYTEVDSPYDESYALLIGQVDYTDRSWDRLAGAEADIKAVRAALEEHGFKVEEEKNLASNALENRISKFVKDHGFDGKNKKRRLLLYFAGHGYTLVGDHGVSVGYIVPIDAPNPAKTEAAEREFKQKAVSMTKIKAFAEEIQARHVMFVFDSCFSGMLMTRSGESMPRYISQKLESPSRHFITSGSANESVPDRSIFRDAFVQGLRGSADRSGDGYITGGELFAYIDESVLNTAKNQQHPQEGRIENANYRGDMIFWLKPENVTNDEETAWKQAKEEDTQGAYSRFLNAFPSGKRKDVATKAHHDKAVKEEAIVAKTAPASAAIKNVPENRPAVRNAAPVVTDFEFQTMSFDAAGNGSRASGVNKKIEVELGRGSGVKMSLVRIPSSEKFQMGSDKRDEDQKPVRDIRIGEFFIGVYEVTRREWNAVSKLPKKNIGLKEKTGDEDLPVTDISWEMAVEFCDRLAVLTGRRYDLPSEAEWEYAARGNAKSDFAFGAKLNDDLAVFNASLTNPDATKGTSRESVMPVGSRKIANSFGLFDTHGNASEWCKDVWINHYRGAPNDATPRSGTSEDRAVRGGSFTSRASDTCTTCRASANSTLGHVTIGFRIVMRSPIIIE